MQQHTTLNKTDNQPQNVTKLFTFWTFWSGLGQIDSGHNWTFKYMTEFILSPNSKQ